MSLLFVVALTLAGAQPERAPYLQPYYRPGLLMQLLAQEPEPAPIVQTPDADALPLPPSPPSAEAEPAGPPPLPSPPPSPDAGLNLEAPQLGPPPSSSGAAGLGIGPLTNLVFGGTIDLRYMSSNDEPVGMGVIHVAELFATTNVGDYLALLVEQVLVTSDLSSSVGQDHGFVYVTIANLPVLPEGTAFRIGRFRLKYGIDAKLDAPANPLRPPAYRTLGLLSDRALEVSGFFGPVDYVVAVALGPDTLWKDVVGPNGAVVGQLQTDALNTSRPVLGRVGFDIGSGWPAFGLSGYFGKNYEVDAIDGWQSGELMNFGGALDLSRLVLKERGSLDASWQVWRLKIAAEYTLGHDGLAATGPWLQAVFARTDISILPELLTVQLQYDRLHDGKVGSSDVGAAGLGVKWNLNDSSWMRAFVQGNERLVIGEPSAWMAGAQLLIAF